MKRKIISFLLALTAVTLLSAGTAYASGNTTSAYNNIIYINNTLTIDESGNAEINITYYATSEMTCVVLETELKKKGFLGLFWTTVDIGTADNKWTDVDNSVTNTFTHTIALDSHGTYKAVTEFTAVGTKGGPDNGTIEYQSEY